MASVTVMASVNIMRSGTNVAWKRIYDLFPRCERKKGGGRPRVPPPMLSRDPNGFVSTVYLFY